MRNMGRDGARVPEHEIDSSWNMAARTLRCPGCRLPTAQAEAQGVTAAPAHHTLKSESCRYCECPSGWRLAHTIGHGANPPHGAAAHHCHESTPQISNAKIRNIKQTTELHPD